MAARKSGNAAPKASASSAKKKDQEEAEKPASSGPVAVKTDADTGDSQDKTAGDATAENVVDQADGQTGGEEEQDTDSQDDQDFLLPEAIMVKTRRGLVTFRRAGLRFGREPVTLKTCDLTDDQIGVIFAEPNLVVKEA
ncbi:HI1506-related protein [Thalassospira marina]|uniref:Mu-like prophage FluMu N-terminal domain-containing protein n=1 Tax=Thalassospira marina TaxID=2048283 RepID=A0ABN5FQM7_9PROT|nr:HI1506-related protein [Thalassospira marina]AUG53935.1 hypothetical protein CSC3H3_15325 [Thalassospira marina]